MNKKDFEAEQTRKLYRIPSGANYQLRSKNAVYISGSNTPKHELAKCIGAIMLRKCGDIKFSDNMISLLTNLDKEIISVIKEFGKDTADFITEAVPKDEPDRRVDLVRLNDNQRFEFETDHKIKKSGACTIYL